MKEPTDVADPALFQALGRGDKTALEALFRRHYRALCTVADRLLHDTRRAEDVVQDFFVYLWERHDRLPTELDNVPAYLRRSVRNRCLNALRDQGRVPVDDVELPDTASSEHSAIERLEQSETRERIFRAIDRLPERSRLVFILCKVEGLSHREVGEQLSISTKTVENQMSRAYRFLKQWLAILLLCYL